GLDDLLGGIVEVIGRNHVQAALIDDLLAQFHIGTLETDNQRNLEANFLDGCDNAFCDDVALHDAAEDVDENAFDARISSDDLEHSRDLLLASATADVTEVCGLCAVELDDVHRRHGKACAVDHAANVAVERNVGEVPFRGLDLLGVFLALVTQLAHVFVAEERVAVERHLGVEDAQAAVFHNDQRVDLKKAHVLLDEGLVEDREQLFAVLCRLAGQSQGFVQLGNVSVGHAGFRIDRNGDDLFRGLFGNGLDVHATLGRDDEGNAANGA